jgi:hypothetical protein
MKRKMLLVVGAIALVLAVTSGSLAANRWIIRKSSQVKPGAISYGNLSAAAKKKLQGKPGTPGTPGAPGTSALAQFAGQVNHGQTLCIATWGTSRPSACLGAAYASDTNALVFGPMPAGQPVGNLSAAASAAPNVGPVTITVLNNGVATAVTCTIAKSTTSCTDTAHSFSTAAGSFLEAKVTNDPSNTVSPRFVVSFTY